MKSQGFKPFIARSFFQPVNLKFCLEGMEETGSLGLEELLFRRKDTEFLQKVLSYFVSPHHRFVRPLNKETQLSSTLSYDQEQLPCLVLAT